MNLNYQVYPENSDIAELSSRDAQQVPLIIIPGLFGSTANWRGFARSLSLDLPVIVIDQRNHGRSPHVDSHSYKDMVDDLKNFCDFHNLSAVSICGHSMGGKVAMLFSHHYPHQVSKLLVLDIAPVSYMHSHAPFLEALMQVDLTDLQSRKEADIALRQAIADTPTRLFLLQSLTGSPGAYQWRINLAVLHEHMNEITGFPSLSGVVDLPALFVDGEKSDYLTVAHESEVNRLFSSAEFATVANAGHWLHAEQPQALLEVVQEFLKE